MKPILTIGEILVEIMATELGDGFLEPQSLIGPFPSGAPAIFIDQVAKLGAPCSIVSAVGRDDFGRLNLGRLAADGVDVSGVHVDERLATGSAFVRYRASGERDFVFNIVGSACATIGRNPGAEAIIHQAGHIHVMGSSLFSPAIVDLVEHAVEIVKGHGGTVSFDPNGRKEMLAVPGLREALGRILAKCDLFLPSGPEISLLTEAEAEQEAIAELLDRGITAIVVKRGDAGASYHDRGGSVAVSPWPVIEVDPTGAGDCFCGAFVTAWLQGGSPAACLDLANACGARAVLARGPMEGTSTRAELAAFLESRQGVPR